MSIIKSTIMSTMMINKMSVMMSLMMIYSISSLSFLVAIKQESEKIIELEKLVNNISDPYSIDYGKYWPSENINLKFSSTKYLAPFLQSLDNVTLVKNYGDAVIISTSTEKMDSIIPNVTNYIDFVIPLGNLRLSELNEIKPIIGKKVYNDSIDSGYVGREPLERLYSVQNYNSGKKSSAAIEFDPSCGFSQFDLKSYQSNNSINIQEITNIVGNNGQMPDDESELDVQMLANSNGSNIWYWNVGDEGGWIYEWGVIFSNSKNVPNVTSLSWGWSERDQCSIINCANLTSEQYIQRANIELQKIALRGVTVNVASGDAGAPGRTSENCGSINPIFPGSSPWVTSVGASVVLSRKLPNENARNINEYKTPLCTENKCVLGLDTLPTMYNNVGWTTGGGFERYIDSRPKWQQSVVDRYLSNAPLPSSSFNIHGRGYPDLAIVGHNCAVFQNSIIMSIDGTSCSTPIWASLVSVINTYQNDKGRPNVGFFNPLLYKIYEINPRSFNDITNGHNHATEYSECSDRVGFVAFKGWDPVSGIGTPNVTEILRTIDYIFSGQKMRLK